MSRFDTLLEVDLSDFAPITNYTFGPIDFRRSAPEDMMLYVKGLTVSSTGSFPSIEMRKVTAPTNDLSGWDQAVVYASSVPISDGTFEYGTIGVEGPYFGLAIVTYNAEVTAGNLWLVGRS